MTEENNFLKLSLDELLKTINELKNKEKIDEEEETLNLYEEHYNAKMDENTKAFNLLKEQIEKNNELDFSQINLDLYDINFIKSPTFLSTKTHLLR